MITEFEFNLDKRDRYLAQQLQAASAAAAAATAEAETKGGGGS